MPSRRDVISMTPEELKSYLAEQRRIILVTIGPDGYPHPMPMNYGIDDQGRIVMTTFRKSQKVRNLERDPRATLLVETGKTYQELKSAVIYAEGEILIGADCLAQNMRFIQADSAMKASLNPEMNERVCGAFEKRVILRFSVKRVVSWDHSKLGSVY
jgi:nitroimidazol reductase NimA-like FMN-containing flavoprotein (pyridoxamine 5'-phosphate oxidase superfamily)